MKYFGLPKYLEYWKRAICSRASDYAFVVSDWFGKPRKLLMLQLIEEQGHFRGKPKGGGGRRLCWLSNQLLNCSSIAGNPNWPTQATCVCSAHADRVWHALWQRGSPGEFYCKYTPVCVCACECVSVLCLRVCVDIFGKSDHERELDVPFFVCVAAAAAKRQNGSVCMMCKRDSHRARQTERQTKVRTDRQTGRRAGRQADRERLKNWRENSHAMSVEAKLGAWLRADSENEAMRICITSWRSPTHKHTHTHTQRNTQTHTLVLNYVKSTLFLSFKEESLECESSAWVGDWLEDEYGMCIMIIYITYVFICLPHMCIIYVYICLLYIYSRSTLYTSF